MNFQSTLRHALVAVVCLVFIGARAETVVESTPVKIRIVQSRDAITVAGLDLTLSGRSGVIRLGQARARGSGGSPFGSVLLTSSRVAGRVLWTVADKDTGRIRGRLVGDALEVRGEMLRVDLKPAPKLISIHAVRDSARLMDVVAHMDLESYLLGVLPREMPADWPIEALKAQAVASRTFALDRIRARRSSGRAFDLENTILDQVFEWHEPTDIARGRLANVRRALQETRGEILTDKRGAIITAYFHADCGGRTETASSVWGGREPAMGTAVDGACPMSPRARWTWSVSGEELAMRLRAPLGLSPLARVREVRAEEFSESGRILRVALVTDDGVEQKLSGHQLRATLGFDRLKSTAFEIHKASGGGFRFEGRGHGHGVGLCQWGARKLAEQGAGYRRILSHYYSKADLSRTYAAR